MFLILLFIMTPLDNFLISSILGKVIILTLLGYTLYYNLNKTNKFIKDFNISITNGNWDALKTNITCSYVFSIFLIILILSVIRRIF
jgi:fumarate reductase subunit D